MDPATKLRLLLTEFEELREEYQDKYRKLQDTYFSRMNDVLQEISNYFEE